MYFMMKTFVLSMILFASWGCVLTTRNPVSIDSAMKIIDRINLEHQTIPLFDLSFDEETRVVFSDGKLSDRAGLCMRFLGGYTDVLIYLALVRNEKDLERVYRHELAHVNMTCTDADHDKLHRIKGEWF